MKFAVAASSMLVVALADYPEEPDMQAILMQHNLHRCMHGMQRLEWDFSEAFKAQAWADKGELHPSTDPVGENLLIGHNVTGLDATEHWYKEVASTNHGQAHEFSLATGHYTQMIWNATTHVGCGKSIVDGRTFWVCRYKPEGNIPGGFEANTGPVVKSAKCASADPEVAEISWAFGADGLSCWEAGKFKVKRQGSSLINVMGYGAEEYELVSFNIAESKAGFPVGSTDGDSPAYEFVHTSDASESDRTMLIVSVVTQELSFRGPAADEDGNLVIKSANGNLKVGHGSGEAGACTGDFYFVSDQSVVV